MTHPQSSRVTRASAARALDNTGSSGVPEVDDILSAATAPQTAFELDREAALGVLFRRTPRHPVSTERSTLMHAARSRLGATKVLIASAAAAALLGGGVAFAATTGNLPGQDDNPRSDVGRDRSSQAPGQSPTKEPKKTEPTVGSAATPSPSLPGTCRAFQAGATSNPGKTFDNPAFSALAAAAGGKENVAAFCTALIGPPKSKPNATKAPQAGKSKAARPERPERPERPATPSGPTRAPNPDKPTALPNPGSN